MTTKLLARPTKSREEILNGLRTQSHLLRDWISTVQIWLDQELTHDQRFTENRQITSDYKTYLVDLEQMLTINRETVEWIEKVYS